MRSTFVVLQGGEEGNTLCIPTADNEAGRQKGKQITANLNDIEYRP
jgi:hypothetical protein